MLATAERLCLHLGFSLKPKSLRTSQVQVQVVYWEVTEARTEK